MSYRAVQDRPEPAMPMTVADHVARLLVALGVREAWGVCGREIIPVWCSLMAAPEITTRHARHESGAGFAALGSGIQTGRPVAIFVTTGPGVTNTITSLEAARSAGARFVLLSPLTPAAERGRLGIQETGPAGYNNPDLYTPGRVFDVVTQLESPEQLPTLAGRLASGFAGAGGFSAHIAIPTKLQAELTEIAPAVPVHRRPPPSLSPAVADELVELLAREPFAVWLGWGARGHATAVRRLLDLTGAPAICSPRGLGIADGHPGFLGVTGNGGSPSLAEDLRRFDLRRTLVLGTRLSEATSGWVPELVAPDGFVHVDLDPDVFGHAYPHAPTLGVQAEIGEVLEAILARADRLVCRAAPPARRLPRAGVPVEREGVVHPVALMAAIQREIVDATDMPVLADASSAMFWGARHLSFVDPHRWLVEGAWGSMGIAGAAVVGAASGRGGAAAAICGDGSMHMQDEISTAVRYGLRAIWIVMNDDGLGIVRAGMRANGRLEHDADYPPTDFAAVARAKGAEAVRVTSARGLVAALRYAVAAEGPFLVDVAVDPAVAPPIGARADR
jgi:acetolactate synthase-1/2/3 large subunit